PVPAAGSAAAVRAGPPATVVPAAGPRITDPADRVAAGPGRQRIPAADGGSQETSGSWEVRIASDADLHEFALRVLKLAGNPRQRRDLVAGRIRFRLAGPPEAAGPRAVHRVDRGAVTERTVAAAAAAGARLVLGPRAVLTPLGKDKARALGVPVEKER
ncbi:MAG: hypothetical protein ACR2FU_11910, partial [Streptosporangiaceae bacterium]